MKARHNRHFIKRRSVALISAAIFCATAAHAELEVGRLPSTMVTGGKAIGVKPNVFLVIDNSRGMAPYANGNKLQRTAGALIAALPQLEGIVRLGYTTAYAGINGHNHYDCPNLKLNGNVDRLDRYIPGLKRDLAENSNYLLADEDFVYGDYGSGYGEVVPRDFSDNYARLIYAWLGGMCPGSGSEQDRIVPKKDDDDKKVEYSPKTAPPYADLRLGKKAYRAAAKAAKNTYSYSIHHSVTSGSIPFTGTRARPLIDAYARVLVEVADAKFLEQVGKCRTNATVINKDGNRVCSTVGRLLGNRHTQSDPLRESPYSGYHPEEKNSGVYWYDAYANSRADNGFPGDKPLSCRKNYTIIIANGPYSKSELLDIPNGNTGYEGLFRDNYNYYKWSLPKASSNVHPKGITDSEFPYDKVYGGPYMFLHRNGSSNKGILPMPKDGKQDPDGNYRFSKIALLSYYRDLRSGLVNDVPAHYQVDGDEQTVTGDDIPKEWNVKNDTANWQHMVIFNLGFLDEFPGWQKVASPTAGKGDALKDYFEDIQNQQIHKDNTPLYDFARGPYGLKGNKYKLRGRDITFNNYYDFVELDFAKAGYITRGGAYDISDYDSIKKVIGSIADRIEKAMAQEVSGAGAVSGGGRVTAVQQMGGNSSALFTSYIDEETVSGNLFAYRNCPLIKEKIKNEAGKWVTNPEWIKAQCGQRLWNAATVLENGKNKIEDKTIFPQKKDGKLVGKTFSWSNIEKDSEAKNALQGEDSEALAKARVDWINGKEDFSDANIAKELRKRPNILIPNEGQRYEIGPDGKPVQKDDGSYVLMDEPGTKIPNRVGEIVYATAQTVDPVGTLGAAHKLNKGDYDTFKNKIKKRPSLVLVGANDGRLYGFTNPKDHYAKLAFSYIPRKVIVDGRLTATTKTSYSTATAKSLVNGPFRVSDAQVDGKWGTYVVGTLGAGGSTAYALEITSDGKAEFKWEIDIDKGQAKIMAPPRIVWLKKDKNDKEGQWVVLLPSGYNANDVSLIVLDLKDGKEIARIDTGAKYNAECKLQNSGSNPYKLEEPIQLPKDGTALCVDNGLGDLTVTDADGDDAADYVYAGDLLGHVWKFDLTYLNLNGKNEKIKVAYERPLFIAKDKQGIRQSITTMIEIDDGAYGEGSMLYFGTGRLFNQQERKMDQRQSFYAVWENPRYFENLYVQLPLKRDESSSYAFMQYEPVTIKKKDIKNHLSDPDSSLKGYDEIRVIKRVDSLETDKYLSYDRNGSNINSAAKAMGWVMDFPEESTRERVIDRARTFDEAIFFSSFEPNARSEEESCTPSKGSVGGYGRFYMLDRLTGNTLETSAFDYNHDNKRDDQDKIRVDSSLLGGTLTGTGGAGSTRLVSPASLMVTGSANFVQLEGVQERGAECDYTRQVIFPGTVNPETGNPETLLGCYQNRYRVWKQPVSGN